MAGEKYLISDDSMLKNDAVKSVSCAMALPVFGTFDYAVLPEQSVPVGSRVRVPFGKKSKIALTVAPVMDVVPVSFKLKTLTQVLDQHALISPALIRFLHWVADYYMQPVGEVVFLAVPLYLKKGAALKATTQKYWQLADGVDIDALHLEKKAPRQYQILCCLKDGGASAQDLKDIVGHWQPGIKALCTKKLIQEMEIEQFEPVLRPQKAYELNAGQQSVARQINAKSDCFAVHLIDGITGSGKTEVYFSVMQRMIDAGKQVLFMLPEIGLTNAFIKRLRQRFGEKIAVIHSAKTAWQRYVAWDQIKRGAADILVATRSGVFAEFNHLGLIIVDEEHDSSYRQEDGVYYHGRDCAVKRAQMLDIPVVMGSATPSLETLKNCETGHYCRHELNHRAQQAKLPMMRVINTQDKVLQGGCSGYLKKAIEKHLAQQGQVILFLNRRGFAPVLMCHACGWRKRCTQCETTMSLHRSVEKMVCHHCARQQPVPRQCADCGSQDIQHYGIGTQQLEETIKHLFPHALVERIDRDSTRLKDEFEHKLALLQSGQPGIFIGTQMLAKGHDYAGISLVGILNMDQGLYSTQYRATERLAQTIIQVSGRAGRGKQAGEVLLQTDFPGHELMGDLVAQNYRAIAQKLLHERALFGLPPYLKVIMFRADALSLEQAESILSKIKLCIEQEQKAEIQCVGPMPSYLKKQEGRYRAQMHCHSQHVAVLRATIKQLMPRLVRLKKETHTHWRVDVDPVDI